MAFSMSPLKLSVSPLVLSVSPYKITTKTLPIGDGEGFTITHGSMGLR